MNARAWMIVGGVGLIAYSATCLIANPSGGLAIIHAACLVINTTLVLVNVLNAKRFR